MREYGCFSYAVSGRVRIYVIHLCTAGLRETAQDGPIQPLPRRCATRCLAILSKEHRKPPLPKESMTYKNIIRRPTSRPLAAGCVVVRQYIFGEEQPVG